MLVGVEIGLSHEVLRGGAQALGQDLGVEAPRQLEDEVNLHIEVVQPATAEVPFGERKVGDRVKHFGVRVHDPVVVAEIIPKQHSFGRQLVGERSARIGFGPTEVERIICVALEEAQVGENLRQLGARLKHQQVEGNVQVESFRMRSALST